MNLRLIAKILRTRRQLRGHESWTRAELAAHQAAALQALRDHAMAHSRFYQRFHRGFEDRPLGELPILTKAQLMDSFDELVTDPEVCRADVEKHLANLEGNDRYLDRYWVSRTSGSTGHPGIFLTDRDEWSTVIASYGRAQEWAGIDARLTRRTRLGVVSSRVPWHQSARVAMSVDTPFIPVRRFDATQPLAEIVAGLNDWQPENLIVYASMSRVLAEEQLAGRLQIHPNAVMCSSEVLTEEAIARVERAWGHRPFNVYAATETAGVASECEHHRMHLYEDLVIPEMVDEHDRPVPPGVIGAKLLVTVLFSRTQPLIRYEMSDRVGRSTEPCDCGLPFDVLSTIEGRAEDVLDLGVSVHPNVFHHVLEALPVREWQVIQEATRLHVLLGAPRSPIATDDIARAITRALEHVGAKPPRIDVEVVNAVTRTALGKAPLVQALRRISTSSKAG
jgi:putative adenylate-forming enzyme